MNSYSDIQKSITDCSFIHLDIQKCITEYSFMWEKLMIKHLSKENLTYFKEIKIRKLQKFAGIKMDSSLYVKFSNLSLLKDVKKMILIKGDDSNKLWIPPRIFHNIEEIKFIGISPKDEMFNKKKLPNLRRIIFAISDNMTRDFLSTDYSNSLKEVVFISSAIEVPKEFMRSILKKNIKIILKPSPRIWGKKSKNILYIGDSLF